MRKYIDAELQIVRVNNNDIVTASIPTNGTPITTPGNVANTPGRRSIWD